MLAGTAAHTRFLALSGLAFLSGLFLAVLLGRSPSAQAAQNGGSQQPEQNSVASASAARPNSSDATQEMNTRDSPTPFSVRVNLVPIRVVVRDSKGHVVTDLRQEDFKVFQDGKPQLISHFSVENRPAVSQKVLEPPPTYGGDPEKESSEPLVRPTRFVALLFDDIHLPFGDLARIRNVADDYVKNSFQPSDRFAILTISGQSQTDFTDDRAKLHEALEGIQPRSVTAGSATG